MSTLDTELRAWQREWREQAISTTTVEELARSVRRGNRHAIYGTLAAALFTIVAVAPSSAAPSPAPSTPSSSPASSPSSCWCGSPPCWLARGTWRPRDESTSAFLEVSIKRCRAAMFGVPVAFVLYAAELIYVLISMQRIEAVDLGTLLRSPQFVAVGWIGGPVYLAGQLWYGYRQRQRLQRLRGLQAQLAEPA